MSDRYERICFREDCGATCYPGRDYETKLEDGAAWECRTCHEKHANRQTRNSFVDSDEIQDTIERGFWEQ
jgi:hypothetical protein